MTAEQLFSILNLMTVAAWLPLVFLPHVRWITTLLPVVVPLLLSIVYVVLVVATLPWSEGGFSSLTGVGALFANPWLLAGGMDALPGIRPLHRRVGGARCAVARHPAPAHRAGARADVSLRTRGLAALSSGPAAQYDQAR